MSATAGGPLAGEQDREQDRSGAESPARGGRAKDVSATARAAAAARAASKFVGRVSQLGVADVRAVVKTWHGVMRSDSEAWFAAERATAHAVDASRRSAEQEILLAHVADCFMRRVWYRGADGDKEAGTAGGNGGPAPRTPEVPVGATEASGQYLATVATLAILVRDHLGADDFALLYRPFAALIPVEELERE